MNKFRTRVGLVVVGAVVAGVVLWSPLQAFAEWWTSSGTVIYNNNSGNVGIGVTNPTQALHVYGKALFQYSGSAAAFIVDRTDGKIASMGAGGTSSTFAYDNSGIFKIESNSRSNIASGIFGTGATTRLVIDSTGKVGVNNASPAEALDVTGNIKLSGNIVSNGDICIGTCQ